jgi:hypothetical protein
MPPVRPPAPVRSTVPRVPRLEAVSEQLAIEPCPKLRKLGSAVILGGTRAESLEWVHIVTLASGEAVMTADVIDRSEAHDAHRTLWWWAADGTCRWRATISFDRHGVVAAGERAWVGANEIDRDGRVLRRLEIPRYLQQLVVVPGGIAAITADASATELWRLDGERWSMLASDRWLNRSSLAVDNGGALASMLHLTENQTGKGSFATLTVIDRADLIRRSVTLGPAYASSVIGADGDGWLVAAVTAHASASWTPPQPPRIEVFAFDDMLSQRWQYTLPATARRTGVYTIHRDGSNVIVALSEQTDRWRRNYFVLDSATGHRKKLDGSAMSAVWQADLVESGDKIAGATVTIETWTEDDPCPRCNAEGFPSRSVVSATAAVIRPPRQGPLQRRSER